MIPQQWAPPCNNDCTLKYAALMQIPWRVFCKKGCDSDGETWEECKSRFLYLLEHAFQNQFSLIWQEENKVKDGTKVLVLASPCEHQYGMGKCDEICYKDPVLKDRQWSAYIDRSPGAASYSEECFHACVSGCGYKFDIPPEKVKEVHPNRSSKLPTAAKPIQPSVEPKESPDSSRATTTDDVPCTSA